MIDAGRGAGRLARLLAALTPAAVEGVVRQVVIAGGGPADLLELLREETGADLAADLAEAIACARSAWILALPAELELGSGWIDALRGHLDAGGGRAVLAGRGGSWLRPAPEAVVIETQAARALAHPDLQDIRRALGRGRARRLA